MKIYSKKQLDILSSYLQNEKNEEGEWLIQNDCEELVYFAEAFFNHEKSFKWLMQNNYVHLACTVDAVHGNDQAKKWLVLNGYKEMLLFCEAANENKSAIAMLNTTPLKDWITVAHAIATREKKKEGNFFKSIFNLGNPFK